MKKTKNIARAIAIFFVIGASGANLAHAEESEDSAVRVMTYNACRGGTAQGEPLSQSANLLDSEKDEDKQALAKFQQVVNTLPDKDARPSYEPRAANPWDRKVGKAK